MDLKLTLKTSFFNVIEFTWIFFPHKFQIASHPNIFVLDTPGVLPPDIIDDEVCSKLALTGACYNNLVITVFDITFPRLLISVAENL